MSKGNVVLGYGRGALGDLVLTRLKGQQVSKARNRHPNNPRTSLQMRQRAGFVSPLKFYTRGQQNFFQFAFENKRAKESDYNTFMRMNVGQGFPLTPAEFELRAFPAFGSWTLTYGSLPSVPILTPEQASNNVGIGVPIAGEAADWGGFCQDLIRLGYAKEGDIFTLLFIETGNTHCTSSSIDVDPLSVPTWRIFQRRVKKVDDLELETLMPYLDYIRIDNYNYFGVPAAGYPINETCVGLAVVISRVTPKGLRVSTSQIVWGGYVPSFVEFRNSDAEVQRVLNEWGATGNAILAGGLLEE